jgi:hypothetical protein
VDGGNRVPPADVAGLGEGGADSEEGDPFAFEEAPE